MASEFEVTITVRTNVPAPPEFDGVDAINEAMGYGLRDLVKSGEYNLIDVGVVRITVDDPEPVIEDDDEPEPEPEPTNPTL